MNIENYGLFIIASFILWVTPGQDTIYIIARSISQGRMAGIVSALGIGTGAFAHAILASAGVSLIILTSPFLFMLVKVLGGGYLLYLGIKSLTSKAKENGVLSLEEAKLEKIYSQGVITNILNPKVALFFIAFLPQFLSHNSSSPDLIFLGLTFVLGGTLWCLLVACCASTFASKLGRNNAVQEWFSKLSGFIYVGLGLNILRAKI